MTRRTGGGCVDSIKRGKWVRDGFGVLPRVQRLAYDVDAGGGIKHSPAGGKE